MGVNWVTQSDLPVREGQQEGQQEVCAATLVLQPTDTISKLHPRKACLPEGKKYGTLQLCTEEDNEAFYG